MSAQILAYDFAGRHNDNLNTSTSRVLQGATYKRQRMVVLVPTIDAIPPKIYLSHCNLIFPPNNGVMRMLCLGDEVGVAYSEAIKTILEHPDLGGWEYVLTLEHDNAPPSDGVLQLVEAMDQHPEYAAISGLYWTKGPGGQPQLWGSVDDPVLNFRPQPPRPGELQEVNGIGMGFALWRLSMFKDEKLRQPWFVTKAGKEGVGTQDLYFWSDAKKYGYRCAVDNRVLVGHYDFKGTYGPPDTMW